MIVQIVVSVFQKKRKYNRSRLRCSDHQGNENESEGDNIKETIREKYYEKRVSVHYFPMKTIA